MACAACGNSILFGGIKKNKKRYCSKKCHADDEISRVAETIPDDVVDAFSMHLKKGCCPKCNAIGSVEIHKSHSIYSVLIYTSWKTNEHILCKKCATKRQKIDFISSFFLGWWSIVGLLITPMILIMNIVDMFKNPGVDGTTTALKNHSRLILASKHMNSLKAARY